MEQENIRGRMFEIYYGYGYFYEKLSGDEIIFETMINDGLNHKTIKKWFYIYEPTVIVDEDGEALDTGGVRIFIKCDTNVDLKTVSNWFKDSEVSKLTGRDIFIEKIDNSFKEYRLCKPCFSYFMSKDIKSNFDWLTELAEYQIKKVKKIDDENISELQRIKFDLSYKGESLKKYKNTDLYLNNKFILDNLRLNYLKKSKISDDPINYFIFGKGGIGSMLYAKELARALYPKFRWIDEDDELIFNINAEERTGFLGYDGQPVICYNNFRDYKDFGDNLGYNSSYKMESAFSGEPNTIRGNVNIIISKVPFEDFFEGMSYRTFCNIFPITNIINLDEDDFMKEYNKRQEILKSKFL